MELFNLAHRDLLILRYWTTGLRLSPQLQSAITCRDPIVPQQQQERQKLQRHQHHQLHHHQQPQQHRQHAMKQFNQKPQKASPLTLSE